MSFFVICIFFTEEGEVEIVFLQIILVKYKDLWNLGLLAGVTHSYILEQQVGVQRKGGGVLCNLLSKYDAISAKTENHSV